MKKEREQIAAALKALPIEDFRVYDQGDWIWGWIGPEPVIGFRWSTAARGWRVYFPTFVYSHLDLDTVLTEFQRIQALTRDLKGAWETYNQSKSAQGWAAYQGVMAALYTGASP